MAMTSAERQKNYRERIKARQPKSKKPKPPPMTSAERSRLWREKQFEIKCERLSEERKVKRKEIIEYVKTMPAWMIDDLYKDTVQRHKSYEEIDVGIDLSDIDIDAILADVSKPY